MFKIVEILKYILVGAVQGIAEFLPISSSAHLIIFKDWLNVPQSVELDVLLHIATLLAIILFYYKDIINLIKGCFIVDKNNLFSSLLKNNSFKYATYLLIGILPVTILGFLFETTFSNLFESIRDNKYLISFMLASVAIYMLAVDYVTKEKELNNISNKNITYFKSLIIGISQMLALIPGTSRSGSTITTAKLLNVDVKEATKFSFFMGIPLFIGALLLKLDDMSLSYILNINNIVAFLSAFIFGILSIKLLLNILGKFGFKYFAIYRLLLALIILFI